MTQTNTASLTVPVYFDFASTLCCVADRVMQRMAGDLDELSVELEWKPFDLTRITGWRRGAFVDGVRRDNALRVARELEVGLRMPTRWLDSRRANAVAVALRGTTKEPAWRERVWTAVFDEGRDLDDDRELARIGEDIGIDAASLSGRENQELLLHETAAAHDAGVVGVPTFMLGEWPLGGIQEDKTMRSLFRRFILRRGSR